MENEKRRRERFSINKPIELLTSDGIAVMSQGINMSESGLLCKTNIEIPHGSYVFFQLPIPGGKDDMTIKCEGTVLKCERDNCVEDGQFKVIIDFSE